MPGPWIFPAIDPEYAARNVPFAGGWYEIKVYGYENELMGTAVAQCVEPERGASERTCRLRVIAASDEYYAWWLHHSEEVESPATYHLCDGRVEECTGKGTYHTDGWRELDGDDLNGELRWLKGPALYAVRDALQSELPLSSGRRERESPGRGGLFQAESAAGASAGPVAEVMADLGEKLANVRRRSRTPPLPRSVEAAGAKQGGRSRSRREKRGARRGSKEGRGRDPFAERSRGRMMARTRKVMGERADRSKQVLDVGRSFSPRGRRPVRHEGRRGCSDERRHDSRERKTKSTRRDGERHERHRADDGVDRGPFGKDMRMGSRRRSDSAASSRSHFREAPSPDRRASHLSLREYAETHPGRLAQRLLAKQGARLSHGGGAASLDQGVQSAAVTYYHSVFLPAHPWTSLRNKREALTLSTALDLLARKEYGRAADVVAQRYKALERATYDGHWERAQWAELLEPEGSMLMDDAENAMLFREQAQRVKLLGKGREKGWSRDYEWHQKGKENGKEKGWHREYEKGKGKGKEKGGKRW